VLRLGSDLASCRRKGTGDIAEEKEVAEVSWSSPLVAVVEQTRWYCTVRLPNRGKLPQALVRSAQSLARLDQRKNKMVTELE
jgi:hypothetical protein